MNVAVTPVTLRNEPEGDTWASEMRRAFKIAVLAVASLLAAQSALGDALCTPVSCTEHACTAACCMQMSAAPVLKTNVSGNPSPFRAMLESVCVQNSCRQTSPRTLVAPIDPIAVRIGHAAQPAGVPAFLAQRRSNPPSSPRTSALQADSARYLRLQVFRI